MTADTGSKSLEPRMGGRRGWCRSTRCLTSTTWVYASQLTLHVVMVESRSEPMSETSWPVFVPLYRLA